MLVNIPSMRSCYKERVQQNPLSMQVGYTQKQKEITTEKEGLAVVWALKFSTYIDALSIVHILTDKRSLKQLTINNLDG